MQQRAACTRPAEIVSIVTEEAFDELDAPPERITGAEVSRVGALNGIPRKFGGPAASMQDKCVLTISRQSSNG